MAAGFANYPKLSFGKPKPKAQPQQGGGLHLFNDPDYRAWVQQHVGTMPTPYTPQQVNGFVHALPAPLTNPQIQSTAMGMLDPAVQQLTSNVQGQTKAGLGAIRGYTDSLASYFRNQAPQQVTGAYAPAIAGTAATNAALADRLSGAGNQASDDLASRLASIGNPNAVDPAVEAIRHNAAGAGNASYATGSAALEALLANQASAQSYVGKMPGITRLGGLQQTGQYEQSQGRALTDQVGQLTAQLPSIVQALRNQSDTRANNRASARRDYIGLNDTRSTNLANAREGVNEFLTGQNTTRGIANEGFVSDLASSDAHAYAADVKSQTDIAKANAKAKADAAKASAPKIVGSSKTGYYAFNPVTGQRTQIVPPGPATVAAPKIIGSSKTGYYAYDAATRTKTLVVPPAKPTAGANPKTTGGLTASGWKSLVSDATKQVRKLATAQAPQQHYENGQPSDVPGTGHPAASYGETLAQTIALGPATPAWKKKATQIVNAQYAEGENGRPWSPKAAQSAATRTAKVAYDNQMSASDARDKMIAAGLPAAAVQAAIVKIYYQNPRVSPVNGVPQAQG